MIILLCVKFYVNCVYQYAAMRSLAEMIDRSTDLQYVCHVGHLDHERARIVVDAIGRSDARKDPIRQANRAVARWNEATNVCHDDEQHHLAQVRGLTALLSRMRGEQFGRY
jgi:hypothetical protein